MSMDMINKFTKKMKPLIRQVKRYSMSEEEKIFQKFIETFKQKAQTALANKQEEFLVYLNDFKVSDERLLRYLNECWSNNKIDNSIIMNFTGPALCYGLSDRSFLFFERSISRPVEEQEHMLKKQKINNKGLQGLQGLQGPLQQCIKLLERVIDRTDENIIDSETWMRLYEEAGWRHPKWLSGYITLGGINGKCKCRWCVKVIKEEILSGLSSDDDSDDSDNSVIKKMNTDKCEIDVDEVDEVDDDDDGTDHEEL